jgi:hypothetical protein
MEVSDQLYTPAALPPGERTPVNLIGLEAGWTQEMIYTIVIYFHFVSACIPKNGHILKIETFPVFRIGNI